MVHACSEVSLLVGKVTGAMLDYDNQDGRLLMIPNSVNAILVVRLTNTRQDSVMRGRHTFVRMNQMSIIHEDQSVSCGKSCDVITRSVT